MSQNSQPKAIVFDMGGVLLQFHFETYINSFYEIGFTKIHQLADRYCQRGPFYEIEAGLIDEKEFFNKIRADLPHPLSDEKIANTWCQFLIEIPQQALDVVAALRKKYPVYLLSNSNPIHWNWVCQRYFPNPQQLSRYFSKCFLSYQMKLCKPKPEIYQQVTKELGWNPEEILFIDDSSQNCQTAQNLGWKTFCPEKWEDWVEYVKAL